MGIYQRRATHLSYSNFFILHFKRGLLFSMSIWRSPRSVWNHHIKPLQIPNTPCITNVLWFQAKSKHYNHCLSTSGYGNAELNFVMNSKVDDLFNRVLMGWMLVVEITGSGDLGCNMPPKGTTGLILRYSTRLNRSMLLTDNWGEIKNHHTKYCLLILYDDNWFHTVRSMNLQLP